MHFSNFFRTAALALFVLFGTALNAQDMAAKGDATMKDHSETTMKKAPESVTVIELVQTPGAFTTTELNLKPGKYQFRVVNQGVDHELGFVIQRKEDIGTSPMEAHVENSFTTKTIPDGEAAYTGVVELTKGEYGYVCPLNPTPHYTIKVK